MSFLQRLTDRLVLQPSTHPLETGERERVLFSVNDFQLEMWQSSVLRNGNKPKLLVIKFPGTGGRAERAGVHPVDIWSDLSAIVWAVNHRGYGGSHGPASLLNFAQTIDAVWQQVESRHPGVPVLAVGNSLGCLSALYLASRYPVAGVMVKNGPALARMIATRPKYNWWNFGFAGKVAQQVPIELDSILNAQRCRCAGLFIRSSADRVIPAKYQVPIFDAYQGPKREFLVVGADHHDRVPETQEKGYYQSLNWLRDNLPIGE